MLRPAVTDGPTLVEAVVERVERAVDVAVGETGIDHRGRLADQDVVREREQVVHRGRVTEDARRDRERTLLPADPVTGADRGRENIATETGGVRAQVGERDVQGHGEGLPGKRTGTVPAFARHVGRVV